MVFFLRKVLLVFLGSSLSFNVRTLRIQRIGRELFNVVACAGKGSSTVKSVSFVSWHAIVDGMDFQLELGFYEYASCPTNTSMDNLSILDSLEFLQKI